mgnify:CR=1 FL=1
MPAIELLTVRVPPELKRWIEEESLRQHLSINRTIILLLEASKVQHKEPHTLSTES